MIGRATVAFKVTITVIASPQQEECRYMRLLNFSAICGFVESIFDLSAQVNVVNLLPSCKHLSPSCPFSTPIPSRKRRTGSRLSVFLLPAIASKCREGNSLLKDRGCPAHRLARKGC